MLISIPDIIKKSIKIYRNNAKLFLKYIGLMFIPGALIATTPIITPTFISPALNVIGPLGTSFLIYVVITIFLSIISFWISIAFIRAIANIYQNKPQESIQLELNTAKTAILPAIGASIVAGLAIFSGFILFIIPGIIFTLWFTFVIYAIAIDKHKAIESIKVSKDLVVGRWWEVFARLFVPGLAFGILIMVITTVASYPIESILEHTDPSSLLFATFVIISSLIITALSLLLAPLTTVASTILYIELRNNPVLPEVKIPSPITETPTKKRE
ncbi:MAG: hypothetical protein COX81_04100 [Candidatus Magasanikbacteria bacterium CG_4_10_14_0_2_um_filter_37_12]|uniref:DUF7847 domain-containing protein n=1 Tax=Candidatus Magasanikbacteria bacterium CG_4_10_14_0_2_um_filter_37_12 TaxID=1974637 RepID=A0A2M7V6J4_9BACT|nr:MAG: hypothetical protein COX81_04100 [Candidatus Magasanikbacteria bacterium CG_4_10_14_0_2_um_filter_37_12]